MKIAQFTSLSSMLLLLSALEAMAEPRDGFWQGLRYKAASMDDPLAARSSWEETDVHYYQSAQSPGILLRMKSQSIWFFTGLEKYGA